MLPGIPRTKKTSNRIISFKYWDEKLKRMRSVKKILPSEAYEEWFDAAMLYIPGIKRKLREAGIALPLMGPIHMRALFYRDAERGDLCGFLQAIGDLLQESKVAKTGKRKGNIIRVGAGLYGDDSQIISFDGSRLLKDPDKPRIEVTIEFEEDLLSRV